MSLINESTESKSVTTTTFDRSDQVIVYNPFRGAPSIEYKQETIERYFEDDVLVSETQLGKAPSIGSLFTPENANTSFNLKNPETGDDIGGTMTYTDVQIALFSLYYHLHEEQNP